MALADRRSDLTRGLRGRFGSDARELAARRPSVWLSLAQIALHVIYAMCAAGLTVLAWWQSPAVGVILYPLAAFYIGSRFRALGNMLHEAVHGLLAPSRRTNLILGYILSFVDFTSLQA